MSTSNICDNGAHLPYGEAGLGTFGADMGLSTDRYSVLLQNSDFLELVKNVPFPEKTSVYNIGDFGTCDGAAAMTLLRKLIASLKEQHGSDVQFQIIHEDQEVNDFNSLFRRLSGLIPEPPSYLQDFENVFALASGTNFYKQCVPSDSMHIILCLTAAHWLSGKPPVNKNNIFPFPNTDTDARFMLELKASEDWEKFLILRSRELKKGGLLVVSTTSNYTTTSGEVKITSGLFLSILNTLWTKFRDMGKISQSEFVNTNMALCDKSLNLLKAPFEDPNSRVRKCNLRLLSARLVDYPCEIYTDWKQRKDRDGVDDRVKFARRFVSAHRCWSNSTFLTGLSGTRSQDEKEVIVNDLYVQVEDVIQNMNPERFVDQDMFSFVYITKE
ncbi:probable S-adenosylmethionine-dependent methyltransferase At5g38780 [Haliotis rubra]|uniref:probable S-adenosylmethionine-dependent methyltransferase At5g38780 n=1 Tax=Haliotis rubra TaxID=36100 RepID=UPI001EE5D34F|nr:probable S-adenosylmethionine-dependent methyltransferase At5g38780 [Haliotis rubra]